MSRFTPYGPQLLAKIAQQRVVSNRILLANTIAECSTDHLARQLRGLAAAAPSLGVSSHQRTQDELLCGRAQVRSWASAAACSPLQDIETDQGTNKDDALQELADDPEGAIQDDARPDAQREDDFVDNGIRKIRLKKRVRREPYFQSEKQRCRQPD